MMIKRMRASMKFLLPLALIGILFAAFPLKSQDQTQPKESPCCFAREGYQGICTVTPGEEETCASILEYMNTPGTAGKTYCGGSKLRGGWEKVECPKTTEQ